MIKTFYALVTQGDSPKGDHGSGVPLLWETDLGPQARTREAAEERAKRFPKYGWSRIATVIVDIPEFCCAKGEQLGLIDKACPDCLANFGPITE